MYDTYLLLLTWQAAAASNRDFVGSGKTIPRWRKAAIVEIDISPYLSEKSSDFDEILYTAADFELNVTWSKIKISKIKNGGRPPF